MHRDFKEINSIAIGYVKNIKDGINTEDNFNKLLQAFAPVINCVVKSIKHNQYIDVEDLKQEASVCLWQCCKKYDFNKKASFYAYFYGCAFNSLTQYVYQHQTPMAVNKHEKERTKALREFANQYYEMNKCYPTLDDYIEAGFNKKLSKRFYSYVLNTNGTDFDLDEIDKNESYNNSVEDECVRVEESEALHRAINELDDKYRQVITLSFFEGLTNVEIAERLNVNEKSVRRYKAAALDILKDKMKDYE